MLNVTISRRLSCPLVTVFETPALLEIVASAGTPLLLEQFVGCNERQIDSQPESVMWVAPQNETMDWLHRDGPESHLVVD